MRFDRLDADVEPGSDLLTAVAEGDQLQNLALPRRQSFHGTGRAAGLPSAI